MTRIHDELVGSHSFTFNPKDNGGESLSLGTKIIQNRDGEDGIYLNQELTLQSYCNSASFNLYSACITPAKLRELADQLEAAIEKARKLPV